MQTYEHRQFNAWPLAALVLLMLPFSTLATRVDERGVGWNFGFGFPGGFIPFGDIEKIELTRTSRWEGVGIHQTPRHGWLWNAGGRDAVMIHKRNGRTVTLGSDEARELFEAIRSRLPADARG